MVTIVFEGDELVVHYHQAETDYILVTFEGAHEHEHATSAFFGKPVIEKLGISCVGITAKANHWYLSKETKTAQEYTRDITKKFPKVIIIGNSMGGHAALAWSKFLNADTVCH